MSRSLFERLRRLFASARSCRGTLRRLEDAARFRPALEALEARAIPSASKAQAIARDDWADPDGRNPVTVAILANDSSSQPTQGNHSITLKPNTIAIKNGPLHGALAVNNQTGEITYTAFANFTGTDSLQYTVKDSKGVLSNLATVSIQVNRPTAADDWVDTDGTNPVDINVLENDTDPDGNHHINYPASVSLVSVPAHGPATLNAATNTFPYTASANFMGTDSFRYLVTDDAGAASAPGTAFVQVNRPTAANDLASFDGTTPVVIDVLENDTDP